MKTFMDKCVTLEEDPNNIEKYVEEWHDSPVDEKSSLHDFLGMSWDAYQYWVSNPEDLGLIVLARVLISQKKGYINLKEKDFYPDLFKTIKHVITNRDDFLDDRKKKLWTIRSKMPGISDEDFEKYLVIHDVDER